MFRTSFINLLYYLHLLSISFVTNVADICRRHVVILARGKLDHFSLSSLVKIIHIQSIYALVMLQQFLPSTSTFSDVIVFCYF
jgi:hypothetical protein